MTTNQNQNNLIDPIEIERQLIESDKTFKLETTSAIKDLPVSSQSFLKRLYDSKNLPTRMLAPIINACFSQRIETFLLSRRIYEKLIEDDPNLKRKTISGTDYSVWKGKWLNSQLLVCLKEGSILKEPEDGGPKKSGVYRLNIPQVNTELRKLFGNERIESQNLEIISFFENIPQKLPDITSPVTVTEHVNVHVTVGEEIDSGSKNEPSQFGESDMRKKKSRSVLATMKVHKKKDPSDDQEPPRYYLNFNHSVTLDDGTRINAGESLELESLAAKYRKLVDDGKMSQAEMDKALTTERMELIITK